MEIYYYAGFDRMGCAKIKVINLHKFIFIYPLV